MSSGLEQEEEYLEEQLFNGEITQKEFNKEMSDLRRGYQAEAEEAAQGAYDQEMERW